MTVAVPPTGLPVEDCVDAVAGALVSTGHAVLRAPPGAGKTTVVPLRLLDAPWLGGRRILVLEPRRLATRAAAARMAWLLGERVGETVGYTTRDERHVGSQTRIEVVTEGILTRRLQHDRSLPGVGLVVFDEVHERNLNTDVALAFALAARGGVRPDLRLLAMSATLETEKVAAVLGGAPVVSSEGRQHPVDVRWIPPPPRQRLAEATASAVLRALREQEGDVLVFLPGAGDIRRVETLLAQSAMPPGVDVRPLFGGLPVAEQDAALAASPAGRRRVVVATDIAETSLTVEGVHTVVDGGQVRVPRYDARSGLTRLQTVGISRASADQRAGRAGRLGPGTAYRLWSKLEHAARRPFPDPEILSVDLAALVLELAIWGDRPEDLAFIDSPPPRALAEGRALLEMLGAMDGGGEPTAHGRAMAELPLHPRLARMVVGAPDGPPRTTACALAAVLEERDVLRGRPDDVPVDVLERVRAVADRGYRHPAIDGAAVGSARRRTEDLARRIGADPSPGRVDADSCGRLLALAYPDRVAQARGGARFRLRNGAGAWVPRTDTLAGEPFLVVAELDIDRRDSRIRIAAALAAEDVVDAASLGASVESTGGLSWDGGELRATATTRIGGLVLGETARLPAAGAATVAALVEQARTTQLAALGWTDADRGVQARVAFARTIGDDPAEAGWPDVSDAALLASVDEWLAPRLAAATGRRDLAAVDMATVLRDRLGRNRRRRLDDVAPARLTLASGRAVTVDYADGRPSVSVRVQDLFGTNVHPTLAAGRVPVALELLSPSGRPVQVTSDLPGFWAGSYAAVRKEMAGRYPKHPWPEDPAAAAPRAPGTGSRPHGRTGSGKGGKKGRRR